MDSNYKCVEFTTQQTETPVWTPAAGYRVVLRGMHIQNGQALAVTVTFKFGSDTFLKAYLLSDMHPHHIRFDPPIYGAPDESVKVTTSAPVTVAITLVGNEIQVY